MESDGDSSGGSGSGGEELCSQNSPDLLRTADSADKRGPLGPPILDPLPHAEPNRPRFDILREDGSGQKDTDKLRRRNSGKGSTWTSSVHVPASDIPINSNNRMMGRQHSTLMNSSLHPSGETAQPDIPAVPDARSPSLRRNPSRAVERTSGRFDHSAGPMSSRRFIRENNNAEDKDEKEDEEEENNGGKSEEEAAAEKGEAEKPPVRMSLMSLLAETDDQMGEGGLAYMMEDEDEDEDDEEDMGGGGTGYNSCCVCMVKHKGMAFEPCGHSFCRLCSREMWVERGNCPLCNNYILEILDIF